MPNIKSVFASVVALWTSRKLWMTIFAVAMLYGIYWQSVYELKTLKPEAIAAYESMYQTMMYGVVTIVVGYTGFSALAGFTRNASSATAIAQSLISSVAKTESVQTINEHITISQEELDADSDLPSDYEHR